MVQMGWSTWLNITSDLYSCKSNNLGRCTSTHYALTTTFSDELGWGLWYLAQISITFQLYPGWQRKQKYTEKTIDMSQVTDTFYHILLYRVSLAWAEFELTTLVLIDTDCIGSLKWSYHTITITMAPVFW